MAMEPDQIYLYNDAAKKYLKVLPGLCKYALVDKENATLLNSYNLFMRYFIQKTAQALLKVSLRYKNFILTATTLHTLDTLSLGDLNGQLPQKIDEN